MQKKDFDIEEELKAVQSLDAEMDRSREAVKELKLKDRHRLNYRHRKAKNKTARRSRRANRR